MMTRTLLLTSLSLGFAASASAQTTTTTTTPATTTTTGIGSATGSGATSAPNTGFAAQTMQSAPTISGTTLSSSSNTTNAFSPYYANPLYQGRPGSTGNDAPGGFGVAMSSTSTGTRTGSGVGAGNAYASNRTASGSSLTSSSLTGSSGRTTSPTSTSIGGTSIGQGFGSGFSSSTLGTSGTRNTLGGTSGFGSTNRNSSSFGGFGSTSGGYGSYSQQNTSVVAQQSRPVAYTMNVRVQQPVMAPAQMNVDLNGVLARSTVLSSPRGISANFDGKVVVLRGTVKDEEEARTAEGIVRLTPGVRSVRNELTYPAPASTTHP
jgi:hypothetical protein